jgi:hypothetical protein
MEAPPQRDRLVAGIAALLLLIGMPIGWLGGGTSTGDAIAFVVALLISLGLWRRSSSGCCLANGPRAGLLERL